MCRLLLYTGKRPILLADLLTRPAHSIINQSFSPKLRIDAHRPLNGDGFGVGWYDRIENEAGEGISKEKDTRKQVSTTSSQLHNEQICRELNITIYEYATIA